MKHTLIVFTFLFLLIFDGCSAYVGGACSYYSYPAAATLKETKENAFSIEFKTRSSHRTYKERIPKAGILHLNKQLPIIVHRRTEGSCKPLSFNLQKEYLNIITTTILWFDSEYKKRDLAKEVQKLFKEFSLIKKDFPHAILNIYGHYDHRTLHEYSSDYALSYAQTVEKALIKKGIKKASLQSLAYHKDPFPDFHEKRVYERITFSVDIHDKRSSF